MGACLLLRTGVQQHAKEPRSSYEDIKHAYSRCVVSVRTGHSRDRYRSGDRGGDHVVVVRKGLVGSGHRRGRSAAIRSSPCGKRYTGSCRQERSSAFAGGRINRTAGGSWIDCAWGPSGVAPTGSRIVTQDRRRRTVRPISDFRITVARARSADESSARPRPRHGER